MSSGQKACAEAQEDWEDLVLKAGLPYTYGNMDCFSTTATLGKQGFAKGFTGDYLVQYISLHKQLADLTIAKDANVAEYAKYLELRAKYEPK